MFALYYPNSKEESLYNVTEHVEQSLFVAEPCCNAAGLEVYDQHL
jgi:hypothetical protein